MSRSFIIAIATLATVGSLYLANLLLAPEPVVTLRTAAVDAAEVDRLIGVFSDRVDEGPFFEATLGELYLDRARLTSDLDDYQRALTHLASVSETQPVSVPLARARLAVHDFSGALAAASAVDDAPLASASITFDAQLGLGRFDEALRSLQTLERLHPSEPAIMIRRAELSFLTGDAEGAAQVAEDALELALDAGLGERDTSFYRTAAARYALLTGDATAAREWARDAAADATGAASAGPRALLGRAEAASGDLVAAIEATERAVALVPDPASLSFLADLYLATGDEQSALTQLDTIDAIAALDQSAYRRGVALARAEHGRSLDEALTAARVEVEQRGDPYAHHLMATVLLALGRADEAEPHALQALSVADPTVWFRAGLVAHANGDVDTALERLQRALDLGPAFHPLYADAARGLIEDLRT